MTLLYSQIREIQPPFSGSPSSYKSSPIADGETENTPIFGDGDIFNIMVSTNYLIIMNENLEPGEEQTVSHVSSDFSIGECIQRILSHEHDAHCLLTPSLLKLLASRPPQQFEQDPLIITKFFCLRTSRSWFVCNFDPLSGDFWGFIQDAQPRWDHFNIRDFHADSENYPSMQIERSTLFQETRTSLLI